MSQEKLSSLLYLHECKELVTKFNHETGNNLQFNKFTIVSATEAKGSLGEYFHLNIECFKPNNDNELANADGGEGESAAILLRFFIKHIPSVGNDREKIMIFRKETFLYSSLLSKLQKYSSEPWCPKVYLCYKHLIVMEDLESVGTFREK